MNKIYEIFEEICGARLTTNIGRIGGFDEEWSKKTWDLIDTFLNINFLVGGNIINKPKKSVAKPGKIKSSAANAKAAPEIIS